jgi:hypothetical protein
MLIKARLKGHEFDLLTLAELFREGDPAVAGDHEDYYLSFTAPDRLLDDGSRLYDAASVLLRRVNGVARTLSSDFRPVALTGRFSDEAGRQHQVVLAESRGALAPTPSRCRWAESSLLHLQHRVRATCSWRKPTRMSPRSWTSSATPTRRPIGLSCTRSTRSCSITCPSSTSAVGHQRPDQCVHCLCQSERGKRRACPPCPSEG